MTEQSGKRKRGNEMRRAAMIALLGVIALCLLFLLIALPLRALNEEPVSATPAVTAAPSPTPIPTPSPTPNWPCRLSSA